jgi:LAGLIDADG DNA endonuclease family protein
MLNILLTYFGCGMLEKDNRNSVYYFSVYKFLDNYDKIMPFFLKNNFIEKKL